MKAVGYIRVSTIEQADSGLGLEAQRQRIQAYATMKGLELVTIVEDNGVSGGKPLATRDGGADLLKLLGRRQAQVVIILKLDRAFRNASDCLLTVEAWQRKAIHLHIVDLGGNAVDTTSAAGKFMLTVLAGAAEMERNLTRERTKAALQVKAQRCERISRYIPYGYDLAGDNSRLTPNLQEQDTIKTILDRRYDGDSYQAIADHLVSQGVPTKSGSRWHAKVVMGICKRAGR